MYDDPRIEEAFRENGYYCGTFEPAKCLVAIKPILDALCGPGGSLDPVNPENRANMCEYYGRLAQRFRDFDASAKELLFHGWDFLGKRQFCEKKRVSRAGIATHLTYSYFRQNDKGTALRWALLTHADDMLNEHEQGGGVGKQWLQSTLGMSDTALRALDRAANGNVQCIKTSGHGDWSQPQGFAEDVVVRFALDNPEFGSLFALTSSVDELPLATGYYKALLCAINAPYLNTTKMDALYLKTTEKGNALERLAAYLFMLVPGWVPRQKLYDEYGTFETDLVVRNLSPISNFTAELLGRHFLVECKNWECRASVNVVGYFLYRIRLTHARFGVLFAKKGITGDEETERAARGLLRKAFHEDGNICVVLDANDLEKIGTGRRFWPILLEGIERIRFGVAQQSRG